MTTSFMDHHSFQILKLWVAVPLCGLLHLVASPIAVAQGLHSGKIVSYVDQKMKGAEKPVLRVEGNPFYMTNIQIRLDKLRYFWGWDAAARDAIMARAAADGFNTVSIPIQWYEVEPKKNVFDWAILDEYLGLALKHKLKVELLWFGSNSGGHVQWLGDPGSNPVHLRTPDYVMYSPSPKSSETTSEYAIRRDGSAYTLDLNDKKLKERETQVLSQVMAHIASWDRLNGSKRTVIGVQLGNEVRGWNKAKFAGSLCVSYMSDVGSAVKRSDYVVWTRMNCVWGDQTSRIEANEKLRSGRGTNVDFIGIDLYTTNPGTIRSVLPRNGGNYRMIMECGAEVSNAAQLQLAALAGDNAYDHYDMCGPDGHALYDRDGKMGFKPHGDYIEQVRTVNKLLNSDMLYIATKANGKGLFVHNWDGKSTEPTKGVENISFKPATAKSQAIGISRAKGEIVLMNTLGGTFTYPQSLRVTAASKGRYVDGNTWIDEGAVAFTPTSIAAEPGLTIRLSRSRK